MIKSYAIYKERRPWLRCLLRLLDDTNQEAACERREAAEAREELERLKGALFGDRTFEPRIARRDLDIDDRLCGEMPYVSITFKRRGFVRDDYRNPSLYSCELVLPKHAVFTPMQGRLLLGTIHEVINFATKGENE